MSTQESAPSSEPAAASASAAAMKVSATFTDFTATKSGPVIIIVVVGIAIAFATAYVLYWMINHTINTRSSYILPESKVPVLATQTHILKGDLIPRSGNGHRASLSFWVYINDINKFSGQYRHILHRGQQTDDYTVAGPYVCMDPEENSIYVSYPASTPADSTHGTYGGITSLDGDDEKIKYAFQARGITFKYIPLQRWVHVAVVVNEDMNGGTITGYVDGELYKSVDQNSTLVPVNTKTTSGTGTAAKTTKGTITPRFDIGSANVDVPGDVYVGGSVNDNYVGFSGLVASIKFFNSDINAQDVYNEYRKGPIDSLLARMGLPAYGVQSPVYRIG